MRDSRRRDGLERSLFSRPSPNWRIWLDRDTTHQSEKAAGCSASVILADFGAT
jgi:hypothetical protein